MAGSIKIHSARCKGCGLCVWVCPNQSVRLSAYANAMGYYPAEASQAGCSGCGMCALVCPDAAIEVYRQQEAPTATRRSKFVKGSA